VTDPAQVVVAAQALFPVVAERVGVGVGGQRGRRDARDDIRVAGLNVLVLPSWYATPAHPVAGAFVRDQARLVARRHRVVVLFSEGPDPSVRRLFALRDGREEGLRVLRLRHRQVPLPRAGSALTVLGLSGALARLRREGFAPDVLDALARRAADGRPPVTLDVVGDGPERPALDARARDLGLDGAVRFHGLESRDVVARRMAESDLFVLPSHVETFAVALVEALAA